MLKPSAKGSRKCWLWWDGANPGVNTVIGRHTCGTLAEKHERSKRRGISRRRSGSKKRKWRILRKKREWWKRRVCGRKMRKKYKGERLGRLGKEGGALVRERGDVDVEKGRKRGEMWSITGMTSRQGRTGKRKEERI